MPRTTEQHLSYVGMRAAVVCPSDTAIGPCHSDLLSASGRRGGVHSKWTRYTKKTVVLRELSPKRSVNMHMKLRGSSRYIMYMCAQFKLLSQYIHAASYLAGWLAMWFDGAQSDEHERSPFVHRKRWPGRLGARDGEEMLEGGNLRTQVRAKTYRDDRGALHRSQNRSVQYTPRKKLFCKATRAGQWCISQSINCIAALGLSPRSAGDRSTRSSRSK